MAASVPSPRVEISDLMEASFWEANKVKIGVAIGSIAFAVLAWQGWRSHQESKQAAGWNALLDPATMGVRDDLALTPEIEGSSAAPWARLVIARNAFQEENYDKAESSLAELRTRGELTGIDFEGSVSTLAADANSEKAFRAANPEKSKPAPGAQQPRFELTTEAGAISIRPYGDAESILASAFVGALRGGKLVGLAFSSAMEGQELSASIDAALAPLPTAPEASAATRAGKVLSNYEGTVAIRFLPPAKPEDPPGCELVFNLSDNGMRDSDSIVVGTIDSGVELLKTVSERETDDSGKLKQPLTISAVSEQS